MHELRIYLSLPFPTLKENFLNIPHSSDIYFVFLWYFIIEVRISKGSEECFIKNKQTNKKKHTQTKSAKIVGSQKILFKD